MADSKSKHQLEFSAIDKASNVIKGIESKFKSLGSVVNKSLALVGVGAVTGLTGALAKSVKLASEEEQVMKKLATAIGKTGVSYALVKGDVESLLKSQQMLTAFADDESAGALATLTQLTGNLALSMKALKVTEDLASTGLFDLDSASKAVGKALTGNTMLLQRMGIQIKAGDDVLAKLEQRFGGSAVQNVNTFSGAMTQLKNTISDAFEAFGGPLLEPLKNIALRLRDSIASPEIQGKITAFAQSIADGIPKALDKLLAFGSWVANNGDTILNFFKALIALRIVSWATSAAASLVALAPAISSAVALAVSPAGLVVLAGASGLAIGTIIGKKIAEAIRASRGEFQQAIAWVSEDAKNAYMNNGGFSSNFIGPKPASSFIGPLPDASLGIKIDTAGNDVADALNIVAQRIANWGPTIMGSRFGEGRGIIQPFGFSRGGIGMQAGRGGGRLSGGLFDTQGGPADGMSEGSLKAILDAYTAEAAFSKLEERILQIAPVFQQMMSAVTNTIVQGLMTGKGQIVDVLNALKGAILSILAQIAAKMAVIGLISLIPGAGAFGAVAKFLGGGLFSMPGGNGPRVPVGASAASGFGGMRPIIVNIGTVYGADSDMLAIQLEQKLALRMRNGTSRMVYSAAR